ncbi:preprotein translocase subunit SecD [Natronomonas amylolytica]|uniref:preprotein translocase subunit SecD n=1 Tax=Natronomonas amylolytica TaxID=3108498 RepID=UPI00300A79F5
MKLHIKKHWRIWLLALFVVVSTVALFPFGELLGGGEEMDNETSQATTSEYTNLQFGLELSGGTQVRAPLVGMTVEAEFTRDEEQAIERTVQQELNVSAGDVRASADSNTVELFKDRYEGNITQAEYAAALQAAGLDVTEDDVRMGVTADTRNGVEDVLNNRLSGQGLSGGQATQVSSPGQQFMLVRVPGANRTEVIDIIGDRGQVEVVALYPENGTYRSVSLLDQSDFTEIGTAQQDQQGTPYVPLRVSESAAPEFQSSMQEYGFDQQGGTHCRNYDLNRSLEENKPELEGDRCLLTTLDGEVVFAAGVNDNLASSFRSGSWADDPSYRTTASSLEEARELEINMREGALRTTLDIGNRGTSFYLQPSLAQQFKPLSIATGFAAVLAVAFVVFLRYRRTEVAAPMLLTAAAEVYILLGFAAVTGLSLDLSHIAGFIAVIGTGVDDLVIIADEIMQQGEVKTSKVFESRFRKAFWVIGAAAATTIIAMSPLAVLSLGDLQGFAIVTIVGVLIGVLITRPAYGDILRILVLGDK